MTTIVLLTISNIFMTFAWYGHLKYRQAPLFKVIVISWGIAFFEYCFQVPQIASGPTNSARSNSRRFRNQVELHFRCPDRGSGVLDFQEVVRQIAVNISDCGYERYETLVLLNYLGPAPLSGQIPLW